MKQTVHDDSPKTIDLRDSLSTKLQRVDKELKSLAVRVQRLVELNEARMLPKKTCGKKLIEKGRPQK